MPHNSDFIKIDTPRTPISRFCDFPPTRAR